MLVENRAGAGGTIAADAVAKAPADGYTLLQNSITTHGVGPHLYAKLPYDPVKDFAPVCGLALLPLIMAVNADLPVKTVHGAGRAVRKPASLNFASSGNGGAPHMAAELFKSVTGAPITHVPYKGSGPAVADLVGGRVQIMFDAAPSLIQHVRSGKLRVLAAASAQRNRLLPEVPTFAELGYPKVAVSLWYGLLAPAGTPRPGHRPTEPRRTQGAGIGRHPREAARAGRRADAGHARRRSPLSCTRRWRNGRRW